LRSFKNIALGIWVSHQLSPPIGSLDTLIAAHALSMDALLITNNTKEFAKVPKLKLDNWVA
jgi:predicted nucleic acid-binding protein